MLAYIFWHQAAAAADLAPYEQNLLTLHQRLTAAGAVIESVTYRVNGLSWMPSAAATYEDWYLVEGWEALGALNTGAITGDRKAPHDNVAHAYATGAGAVYELRAGSANLRALTTQWIAKPRGMSYDAFDGLLKPFLGEAALWRRQMVLGPATEFCLSANDPARLPDALTPVTVVRTPLAAEAAG